MKRLLSTLIMILAVSAYGHCQKVQDLVFECLKDPKSGGRMIQPDTSADTIKMVLKTHGPCKADFEVRAKEVEASGVVSVIFDIYDRNETYKGGKLECGCMYKLQFKILDYEMKPNFRGWGVNNNTMPKKVWQEWYWDSID